MLLSVRLGVASVEVIRFILWFCPENWEEGSYKVSGKGQVEREKRSHPLQVGGLNISFFVALKRIEPVTKWK